MFQFSLRLSIFDRVANLKKKKSKEERKYVGTFFQPALRKNEKERKGKSSGSSRKRGYTYRSGCNWVIN